MSRHKASDFRFFLSFPSAIYRDVYKITLRGLKRKQISFKSLNIQLVFIEYVLKCSICVSTVSRHKASDFRFFLSFPSAIYSICLRGDLIFPIQLSKIDCLYQVHINFKTILYHQIFIKNTFFDFNRPIMEDI